MKKVISVLLVLVICFSFTSCAYATELKDIVDTRYEDSVEMLTKLNIINGFEDNTFRPSEKVTRAQLAKMLVISMGMEEDVEDAERKYIYLTDVMGTHWGYGYIVLATENKLVTGYPNGTFVPDGDVTYAEATTMIIRALGYENAVENTKLSWPDNYMVYADEELDLFDSVPAFKASDDATRGDIAIMLLNALKTGMATIVAQNDNGFVYGEGTPMITEYFDYTYLEDAEVDDIEFLDNYKRAEVTLKEDGKKAVTYTFDTENVLEMFGKTITFLYDNEEEEFITFNAETEYKIVKGEVTRISSKKIYIANRSIGYNIPDDDNILLCGIDDLDEAAEVTLLVEGNSARYCIATGAEDVMVGVVTDDYEEIDDDEYGITVRELGLKKGGESYFVADEDNWPDEDDIILYFINSDDMLVVLETVDMDDAEEIDSIDEDDYIELVGNDYYEFEDEDDYTVIIVDNNRLSESDISEIDERNDMICVIEYNGHLYFFVYEGGMIEDVDSDILDALDDLEYAIEDALELDEEDYSQESYANLISAIDKAKEVDYTYSLSQIDKAIGRIEDAYDDLEKIAKSERDTVAMKKELRALVTGDALDAIEDEDEYTARSWDDFYEVYEEAVDMLSWTDAEEEELSDMYDALEEALDDLVAR